MRTLAHLLAGLAAACALLLAPTVPAAAQVTVNRVAVLTSAGCADPDARTLFAAFTTAATSARQGLICTAIGSLKAAGVWTKLDALYLFAAADSQAARVNWKTPGTYNATATSSPTFTADRGYAGDGVASYVDTNFADTTAAVNWSQDSASLGVWVNVDAGGNNAIIGHTSSSNTRLNPRDSSNSNALLRIHAAANQLIGSQTSRLGWSLATRRTSTASEMYRATTSIGTSANASAATAAGNITILKAGGATFSADRVAAAAIGGALTTAENTALYNALNTYLTALGAN